jgi:arginyl-tRNA synthetase
MNERLALTSQKEENEAEELIEITTYIREDQALALEILENARRYSSGANFDKGTLIREALDLMIEKYRTDFRLIFR